MNNTQTGNDLQQHAVALEKLISAALAVLPHGEDCSEAWGIMDMAHSRARKLNVALDSVNALEVVK